MSITVNIINCVMLIVLLCMVKRNKIVSTKKTGAFTVAITLTIIVMVAESFTCIFDGLGGEFSISNKIFNAVGFSVSPFIPLILASVFSEKIISYIKILSIPAIINSIFSIMSLGGGFIFNISDENIYSRGSYFPVYIIAYVCGMIILAAANYLELKKYQTREKMYLIILFAISISGTFIQIIWPSIHVTWHCITLSLVMYYLFLRELQFKSM